MKPEDFALIETLDREALARHPLWKTYRPRDRDWILGFGVAPEQLEAELERFGYCGPEPLFPVLACERVPEVSELFVAARFRLAAGPELPGYLLEPRAFGLFGEREYVFNRGLPAFSCRMAEKLAAELGIAADAVFPLGYRTLVPGADGAPLSGAISAPW